MSAKTIASHLSAAMRETLISHMRQDKKAEGGDITLILARAIGETWVEKAVAPGPLADFLVREGAI